MLGERDRDPDLTLLATSSPSSSPYSASRSGEPVETDLISNQE